MRIDLEKLLFIGLEKERSDFFNKAQEAGVIEFIDCTPKAGGEPLLANEAEYALARKVLRTLPPAEQLETEDYTQADQIVHSICQLHQIIEVQREELRVLRMEIGRVAPFGDFSLKDLQEIQSQGKRVIQFFASKSHAADSLVIENGLIPVGSAHGMDYFISIQKTRKSYSHCVEMQIPQPVGELKLKQSALIQELHTNEQTLKTYAKYAQFIQNARVEQINAHNYRIASKKVQQPLEDKLFVAEGWAPVNKYQTLQALADVSHVHMEKVALRPSEEPPTYLENEGVARIGEDLIRIYDTPSNTDNDPSLWVFVFFSLFFAMIVGDGGYGLIYLGLALLGWYKYPNMVGAGRRFLKLMTILSVACVVWGFLTATFFGVTLHYDHPFRQVAPLDYLAEKKIEYHMHVKDSTYGNLLTEHPAIKDTTTGKAAFNATKGADGESNVFKKFLDGVFMELVLFIAVVHLILSLCRYGLRNWPAVGWVLFLIGAYLYVPFYLGSISMTQSLLGISVESAAEMGKYLMITGVSLAVILSLIQNRLLGLLEVTNLLGLTADVLSYLRIYALALSGAIMASTVNDLAAGLPAFFGILLMGAGHILNMVLATMGGVIHGLRLNFLEWYRYSFQGGGKPFTPLLIQKVNENKA